MKDKNAATQQNTYIKKQKYIKKRKTKGKCLPKHKKIKTCDLKILQ